MIVPHIPLEHQVASGSNPDPTLKGALPASPASFVQSLLLVRRDTNGAGH